MSASVDTVLATYTRSDGAVVTLAAMAPTTWRSAEFHVTVRRDRALVSRHTVRFALRPAAGAPREPLAAGCVRAVGNCTCEGCMEREADTRAMRSLVAATMVECGASKATGLLVLRGIFDAEALDAVREGCEDISESKNGPMRSLMLAWLGDLVAGRFDRIERSDAAWHTTDCVPCVKAAFDTAAPCCDRCAGEVTP